MPEGLLVFLTVGSIGLLLLLAGIFICILESRKKQNCTGETVGTVVRYSFANDFPAPIVEYMVEGKMYTKKRRFRGSISIVRRGLPPSGSRKNGVFVDSKDIVHIHRGAYLNMRAEAERLYPLGTTLPVWYNPEKPKQAYVEKISTKAPIDAVVFLWVGLGLILLGALLGFLIG